MAKENKVIIKKFMNDDVRVVNGKWMVLKDMFGALDRLNKKEQISTPDKNKIKYFLEGINKISDSKKMTITTKSNKSKSRDTQGLTCIKLKRVPVILTQFQPSVNKKNIEKSQAKLKIWFDFMQFVDRLLEDNYDEFEDRYIDDKVQQVIYDEQIQKLGLPRAHANHDIAIIMKELTNYYPETNDKLFYKENIEKYNNYTEIDLYRVRRYIYKQYIKIYNDTNNRMKTRDKVLNKAISKYGEDCYVDTSRTILHLRKKKK